MAELPPLLEQLGKYHPKKIDLSLDRLEQCLEKLGNPHLKLPPTIHIAGTNGKGSTGAFLAAILNAHGHFVHKYTSPHLIRFNERIGLASGDKGAPQPISDEALIKLIKTAMKANDKAPITFFEITTALAFLAFAQHKADWLILETGLGGRFDATNIIPAPRQALITPIGLDHKEFLGDDVKTIAREKAGILKKGAMLISARQSDPAKSVLEKQALQLNVPALFAGQDFDCFIQNGRMIYQDETHFFDLPIPRYLKGRFQIENASLAIAAAKDLLGDELDQDMLGQAMNEARNRGRLEQISPNLFPPLLKTDELWLDGGHNPHAARQIALSLSELEEKNPRPLHLIIAMLNTKDVAGFLEPFKGLTEKLIAIQIKDNPNSTPPETIVKYAHALDIPAQTAGNLDEALAMSTRGRKAPARILICGSLYLAGQVLAQLEAHTAKQKAKS